MSDEFDIHFCPNCRFDIGMHRELLRHQAVKKEQERIKIYEEVKAEIEAKRGTKPQLVVTPVHALEPGKRVKRIEYSQELIARVKELRSLSHDGKKLTVPNVAEQAKIPVKAANYIIYHLLPRLAKKAQKYTPIKTV